VTDQLFQPLVDIDIEGEITPELESLTKPESEPEAPSQSSFPSAPAPISTASSTPTQNVSVSSSTHGTLATPAVRHLSKELKIDISDVNGTGKDGRVTKEDLQKFDASRSAGQPASMPSIPLGEDKVMPLNGIQTQMFKAMTRSLAIPHFLYSDSVDFTSLTLLRKRLNSGSASSKSAQSTTEAIKLSALPFIIKAVSLAFTSFPSINAHLSSSDPNKPVVTQKAAHNIGVAIDTPQGLIVPVIRNVQSHSISSISEELARLSVLARSNKLSSTDLSGATFTISNIGSIGGLAVAPVIVQPQVAILGVGRSKIVPAFDENGDIVKKEETVFSWSADHRVVDGATAARCAEKVKFYLEAPERMIVGLK
jgi:2-oxoisovalerate dehydrogenase E2 component (dihydrolipoyl transacylase)